MPRRWTTNANGKECERYEWPCRFIEGSADIDAELRQLRRRYVDEQVQFAALRKQSDGMASRVLKDDEKSALRLQRACALMLPWLGDPDKSQAAIAPSLWPIELSDKLDCVSMHLLLKFG